MAEVGDYRILHEAALRDHLAGISDLKALIGQIHFEFDPCELRRRERARL